MGHKADPTEAGVLEPEVSSSAEAFEAQGEEIL